MSHIKVKQISCIIYCFNHLGTSDTGYGIKARSLRYFRMKMSVVLLSLLTLQNIAFAGADDYPDTLPNDTRKVRSSSSPDWLEAVGRMVSHTSSTDQEQCSMTLLNNRPWKDGIIGVTAGHCVDHWRKIGGTYEVRFNEITFTSNSGKVIKRAIVEVIKTEMNPADYAIVKLNAPIPRREIQPLLNSPYHYADILNDEDFSEKFKSYAIMAGFSADKGLGKKGKVMTYDKCRAVNGGARGLKKAYCYAYEGASGGPLVSTVALNEDTGDIEDDLNLAGTTQHLFVGSIVGSRGGDDSSKTMFTEATYYFSFLDNALTRH